MGKQRNNLETQNPWLAKDKAFEVLAEAGAKSGQEDLDFPPNQIGYWYSLELLGTKTEKRILMMADSCK